MNDVDLKQRAGLTITREIIDFVSFKCESGANAINARRLARLTGVRLIKKREGEKSNADEIRRSEITPSVFLLSRLGESGEEEGPHRDGRSGNKEAEVYLRPRGLRHVRLSRCADGRHVEIQHNGSGGRATAENSIFRVDGEYPLCARQRFVPFSKFQTVLIGLSNGTRGIQHARNYTTQISPSSLVPTSNRG